MNRREFITTAAALAAAPSFTGCATTSGGKSGRILFGACRGMGDVKLLASVGYDFWEWDVPNAVNPDKDEKWWAAQKGS